MLCSNPGTGPASGIDSHSDSFANDTLAALTTVKSVPILSIRLSWNEVSRRYVDYEPEFYTPDTWRGRPLNSKQGSNGQVPVDNSKYDNMMSQLKLFYETLLNQGVAPEMARMVLPQSMMTEWYWSGTLYAFARVCNLRCEEDTQLESRVVADMIDELVEESFPVSWKYLRNRD